ncbi:MAG: hypothetical protein ACHQE5_08560, partial [Actinomycetes bacterium]
WLPWKLSPAVVEGDDPLRMLEWRQACSRCPEYRRIQCSLPKVRRVPAQRLGAEPVEDWLRARYEPPLVKAVLTAPDWRQRDRIAVIGR